MNSRTQLDNKKGKEDKNTNGFTKSYCYLICNSVVIYGLVYFADPKIFGEPSPEKVYASFEDFYPFYISQHQDYVCRVLHVIGTSILFGAIMFDIDIFFSLVPAILIGMCARAVTISVSHGFFEMILMMVTFLFSMHSLSGTGTRGLLLLICTYGFAWIGHFFYEQNKPATFIYPIYSLFGDIRLWTEILTAKQSLAV